MLVDIEGEGWKIEKIERKGYVKREVIEEEDMDEEEIRYLIGREGVEKEYEDIKVKKWGKKV